MLPPDEFATRIDGGDWLTERSHDGHRPVAPIVKFQGVQRPVVACEAVDTICRQEAIIILSGEAEICEWLEEGRLIQYVYKLAIGCKYSACACKRFWIGLYLCTARTKTGLWVSLYYMYLCKAHSIHGSDLANLFLSQAFAVTVTHGRSTFICLYIHCVSKKTSPMFLAITRESNVVFS